MRKSRILTSLIIIGIASTLSVSGALALHQNGSNSLEIRQGSGEGKDLRIVEEDSSPWSIGSAMPGEKEHGKITLDHAGDTPAGSLLVRLDLTSEGREDGSNGMAEKLIVTSMEYGGDDVLGEVEEDLGSGKELTLKGLDGKTLGPEIAGEFGNVPPADGPGGEKRTFEMTVKFEEDAGNKYQGQTVGFDVSFTLK